MRLLILRRLHADGKIGAEQVIVSPSMSVWYGSLCTWHLSRSAPLTAHILRGVPILNDRFAVSSVPHWRRSAETLRYEFGEMPIMKISQYGYA
jgi:hypothetical protein